MWQKGMVKLIALGKKVRVKLKEEEDGKRLDIIFRVIIFLHKKEEERLIIERKRMGIKENTWVKACNFPRDCIWPFSAAPLSAPLNGKFVRCFW